MLKDRKEYRKNFSASGLLHIGGETLQLNCYDVSVKGAMVEVMPGELLSSYADFQTLLKEDQWAEIFIEDLMMTGLVYIAWVKKDRSRIMLGVEFNHVLTNCKKLWRKRHSYRKKQIFSAELIVEKDRLNVQGINFSKEGICLHLAEHHPAVKVDALVKVHVNDFTMDALGKVVWIKNHNEFIVLGLQAIITK